MLAALSHFVQDIPKSNTMSAIEQNGAQSTDAVFRATGLTKVYRMGDVEVHALRGIDIELFRGEFVVLLGPSGSGKSTLLNILGGLDHPTAGQVFYEDNELTTYSDNALTRYRRDYVGFVFQFYNLIPSLSGTYMSSFQPEDFMCGLRLLLAIPPIIAIE